MTPNSSFSGIWGRNGSGPAPILRADFANNALFETRFLTRSGASEKLNRFLAYEPGSGKVGLLAHNANVVFRDVRAWKMSL